MWPKNEMKNERNENGKQNSSVNATKGPLLLYYQNDPTQFITYDVCVYTTHEYIQFLQRM